MRLRAFGAATLHEENRAALGIALSYLAFGVIWILASDRVLLWMVRDARRLAAAQTLKGWVFVLFTSLLLYALIRAAIRARAKIRERTEESERFAERLIDNLPGAVYACANDRLWTMTYLSPYVEDLVGYRPEELVHNERLSFASLIHPNDRERVWRQVQAAVRQRRSFQVEYRLQDRRGGLRWIREHGCAVYAADGEVLRLEGFLTDVTERRQAQEQIERQVDRLRSLLAIDRAIAGSVDPTVSLGVVLDQVTAELDVDAAAVLRFDPDLGRLDYAAERGVRMRGLRDVPLQAGEGHAGLAALTRETVRVEDLRRSPADPLWARIASAEGFIDYFAVPLVARGQLRGVLELAHRAQLKPDEGWLEFLEVLAGQTAIALDGAWLLQDLERTTRRLGAACDAAFAGWACTLDLRNDGTPGRSRRVAELALRIAERLDVAREALLPLRRGCLLRSLDPGKCEELRSALPLLGPALEVPAGRRERWDGTGGPLGLRGEQIPLTARIAAVADAWDALRGGLDTRGWTADRAREHIREESGKHFDPRVVEAFLSLERETVEWVETMGNGRGVAGSPIER